ncbi:longitudinals lacking protein, isoforms F/I/K/T-like [Daphnia pulicaria]|uniref:longitudinals lacking protein, isoforms F/I/K/T-like n=1 Tax=Daphnia pulicaria TaxID=35523 RepID=UPI001EEC030F|nr:longitudinals lacking protein, isoforms F/I/K/T-like [Daphnia pulicaria]
MENGEELVGPPQLSLQWHQHHNTLVSLLDALWERQELVDVTLAADGQHINVHRIVLCACSKFFQDVLTLKGNSDKQIIVFLKDVSYSDLKALVDYMYKGEVRINEDQLNSFLHTAKSLGIRGLMGDGKKVDIENDKKRKRRHSVELSSDQEEEEEDNSLTASSPPPPPPPLLKHKTSLTKPQNLEVKCELPMNQETRFESAMNTMQPETESLTQNSSINSGQELEDDELDLFQHCGVNNVNNHHNNHLHHPGPSRLSAEELHSSGQDLLVEHMAWGSVHNGSVDNHHLHHHDPDPGPGRHSCPRCGRTYKWKQTLLRHVKYECGVEPQFICPICRAPFHHRNVLQRHMNLHSRPK